MNNPKISIIIPIFNAEKYLANCLDSILCQSYTNFEIILINDGSTDSSCFIADDYCKKDNRIKLYSKINEGVSIARNVGLENARGEWIYFIDADDRINLNLFDFFSNENFQDIDIIQFGYKLIGSDESISIRNNYSAKYDSLNEFEAQVSNKYFSLWIHFIKKDVIDKFGIKFLPNIKYGEDITFMIQCFLSSNRIQVFDFIAYYYFVRENSAMTKAYTFSNAKIHLDLIGKIIRFYEINNFKSDVFIKNRIIYMINSYFSFLAISKDKISSRLINKTFVEFKCINKGRLLSGILNTGFFRIISISPILYLFLMKVKNKLSKKLF